MREPVFKDDVLVLEAVQWAIEQRVKEIYAFQEQHMRQAYNPHTSLEIVFFEPCRPPDPERLFEHIRLARPHYLDLDLRVLYPDSGNRAAIFTLVTSQPHGIWQGATQRTVYWWRDRAMPSAGDIHGLESTGFDGLLLDTPVDDEQQAAWQDRMASQADDLPLICFGTYALQHR